MVARVPLPAKSGRTMRFVGTGRLSLERRKTLVFVSITESALTRFAHVEERKMTLIDLDAIAAMIGVPRHQDLRLLQNTYYRETVEEIANRL